MVMTLIENYIIFFVNKNHLCFDILKSVIFKVHFRVK